MVNKAILNRRSVRIYSDQQISDEVIKDIIKAAQLSPTARNNRAWEFVVIKEQAVKDKLYEITSARSPQDSAKKAPVVIVPVIDTLKSVLPIQDLSMATENIFIQVSELGLGAVWKNIVPEEAELIKKTLKIPDNFTLINIIPVGYPDQEVVPHTEEELGGNVIHHEQW